MLVPAILVAAATSGVADFIAGLLVGAGIGFLLSPAARSWLTRREWAEASRRARLTDRVLARLEEDARRHRSRQKKGTGPSPWRP